MSLCHIHPVINKARSERSTGSGQLELELELEVAT